MSSSFELRGRPAGRANNRGGGRGRGRGAAPRAAGPQHGRPAERQVAYGRDPADDEDDDLIPQQNGNFPPSASFATQRSHHPGNNSSRGNFGSHRGKMTSFNNRPTPQVSGQVDEGGEMNSHLSERLIASKRPRDKPSVFNNGIPRNLLVEKYERALPFSASGGPPSAWRALPDVPSTAELMTVEVDLPVNEVGRPWETVDDYLGAHYELLREDAFSPLRDAVGQFRAEPTMDDRTDICIYENCRIIGITFSNSMGICIKMSFSTNRARKRIRWENSKRLCPGALLALTTDDFQKVIRVATVAARPISGLEGDLPHGTVVDLLLHPDELELDPTKTWTMVEARSGYFEAFKHTLRALQRMDTNFPLSKILTLQDIKVGTPQFLKEKPELNLAPCFNDHADISDLRRVNVLQKFPVKADVTTSMDEGQLKAVERILTKELAIVQGPPGCGKTFISTKALAVMIANSKNKDPPIIVACQTNHALDQLLREVIAFEPRVIRLGGRTQDRGVIRERTLYKIRRDAGPVDVQGSSYNKCRSKFKRLEKTAEDLVECLYEQSITPDNLLQRGVITQGQRDSFHKYTEQWVKLSTGNKEKDYAPMVAWIGDALLSIPRRDDMAFEYEDEDIGMEELKDLEAEFDDEWDGRLWGIYKEFSRKKRAMRRPGVTEETVRSYMKKENVWEIPEILRGDVYARLETLYTASIEEEMRKICREYAQNVAEFKIARWEKDLYHLQKARVIGMTTTGVSKYRSLVAALEPRICLIEEAAETLEGPLIAACYPSIQQLVLVGDHQQLKGHCNVSELEKAPYNLSISMFERLVKNQVEYTMLKKQRRMRPEIRRILMPIYKELEDDHQVLNMPPVPGMGKTNLFFFAHEVPEEQDELSKKNTHEAQMIVGFCNYLVENGTKQKEITILTFYTGQARELRRLLGKTQKLNKDAKDWIRVATVDSFQGEENDVVILSLCRSNNRGNIGFLNVPNRVCVSLSRAKRGFYMFGNANLLSQVSGLWWDILHILNNRDPVAIGGTLPVTCEKHKRITYMQFVSDWLEVSGGCREACGESLNCGHKCTLRCHPYEHNFVRCVEPCPKIHKSCGHPCRKQCYEECATTCRTCALDPDVARYSTYNPNSHMDRLAEGRVGVPTTDSSQLVRGPPPTQYQNREPGSQIERRLEQFPNLPPAKGSQLVRGPPPTQYQNHEPSSQIERRPEPFPKLQPANGSQMVRGPPLSHYQSSNPNNQVGRLSEQFPNLQTANGSQMPRGPQPSQYQNRNPSINVERTANPYPNPPPALTNQVARGPPPPNNYQARNSTKNIEILSERLAEIKTTDMIPTMLNPTSPRKKGTASSEVPTRALEAVAPLISWDNTPTQNTIPNAIPDVALIDFPVMQPTVSKPQKHAVPTSPVPLSEAVSTPQTLTENEKAKSPLPSNNNNFVHSPTPQKACNTPPIVSLDEKAVQAIVNQDQKEKGATALVPAATKASTVSTPKAQPKKASAITDPLGEPSVDHNSEKLKKFVQKGPQEKLGIVNSNGNGNGNKSQKPGTVKATRRPIAAASAIGTAEIALISFDDEPIAKSPVTGVNGVTPFNDFNKIILPTQKQDLAAKDEKRGGFMVDKKNTIPPNEKKDTFSKQIDLLGDF
ncbi:hypothetical protein TWF730_003266 [Orbilia blumenaviensis]|uniref:P-loop containing nucleoside triphosphate hydrolase protein n=1 Tax=Orbilia blumenaviensis TaxID=1796055 RepID=A0AAV9U523_9PEZI